MFIRFSPPPYRIRHRLNTSAGDRDTCTPLRLRTSLVMDPRQHEQDFSGANPQRVGGNFGFNGIQNDPFSSFVHTDNEPAFDPAWSNPAFPSQQQHINGFDQGNHAWTPNPYQSPNFLATPDYGVPQREYDQQFSRSPSAFGYGGFDPGQTQSFSEPNPYDNPLGFDHGPLNNSAQYEYPGSAALAQTHETISPQALQNYPASFPQTSADDSRQVSHCSLADFLILPISSTLTSGSLTMPTTTPLCLCVGLPRLNHLCIEVLIGVVLQMRHQTQLLQEACISSPL